MSDPHEPNEPDAPDESSRPEVGSIGEEAAKLLGALSSWAQESGADTTAGLGATVSGLAGLAAEKLGEVDEHLATGAAECTWCPVCRTVHAIRETSPEVKAHLASAASSLVQAVAGLLATVPQAGGSAASRSGAAPGGGSLERIDLDGDDEDDDDD